MMYSYPFFSFPSMRRTSYYSSYPTPMPNAVPTAGLKQTLTSNRAFSNYSKQTPSTHAVSSSYRQKTIPNGTGFSNRKPTFFSSQQENETAKSTEKRGYNNFLSHLFQQEDREDDEKPLFELFGIKLYSDDILLLCLIFFLYQEEVKDQYLFFALILLLLS